MEKLRNKHTTQTFPTKIIETQLHFSKTQSLADAVRKQERTVLTIKTKFEIPVTPFIKK